MNFPTFKEIKTTIFILGDAWEEITSDQAKELIPHEDDIDGFKTDLNIIELSAEHCLYVVKDEDIDIIIMKITFSLRHDPSKELMETYLIKRR